MTDNGAGIKVGSKELSEKLFGYTTGGNEPYKNATFIQGDFNDSVEYYKDLVNSVDITVGHHKTTMFGNTKWVDPKNKTYALFSNNCLQQTIAGLARGSITGTYKNNDFFKDQNEDPPVRPNSFVDKLEKNFATSYTEK